MSLNRRARRKQNIAKRTLNDVEFKAFLDTEAAKKEAVFTAARIAQSVLFALRYPDRKVPS